MSKIRRIGAHLSTVGGVDKAVERAHEIGANALQVFSGSPRMWRRTALDKIDAQAVKLAQEKLDVTPIFTHALYLINLASDKAELVEKSATALKHDLQFDAHIGGAGVIVHLGSHQGRGFAAARQQVAQQLKDILAATPKNSHLLIENAAAHNGKVGGQLEEIAWLLKEVKSPRLGWCFDTCHAFAAGYSLDGATGNSALSAIAKLKLFGSLHCIHVNDSKDLLNSGRDRHANIGDGEIPKKDLKQFLRDQRIAKLPIITEAPGIDGGGPDAENIRRIKSLVE
ncbi:MAG: deoxyribonuclease IV [Candidatus Paceibacterota bacterium]